MDEIKNGTSIASNKVFERYLQHEFEASRKMYQGTQGRRKPGTLVKLKEEMI